MRMLKLVLCGLFTALILVSVSAPAQAAPHFQGDEPECTVTGTTVTCEGSDIAGLGNLDARATLTAVYSGTVECTNPGGQVVEAHETTIPVSDTSGDVKSKNGRLTLPELDATAPTELTPAQERQLCPNPRWDATLTDVALVSFTYTIELLDRRGNVVRVFFSDSGPDA